MIRGVVVCMLLALARPAGADDVVAYEAEGDAAAASADARTAALDDAFARAVTSALADLIAGDVRTAHRDELDKEIVGHARLWVARFTVTKDEVDDDRRELTVSVRVDRDKLRARLGELKIAVQLPGDVVGPTGDAPGARTVTVLLRVASAHGMHASYGKGADHDLDGLAELTARLRDAGLAVHRAPDDGAAPIGTDAPDAPDVRALADAAKAELALVASVMVSDPTFVRGQPTEAVLATAQVDLVDGKTRRLLGHGTASAAAPADAAPPEAVQRATGSSTDVERAAPPEAVQRATGSSTDVERAAPPEAVQRAIELALAGAAADALPAAAKQLGPAAVVSAADDHPITEPGIVLVRLSPKTPYSLVLAEQRYLAGARGVHAAALRRLSPAGWVIGVATTDPIERVAQVAKKPPASDTSSAVKIVGDVVEVALTGAP